VPQFPPASQVWTPLPEHCLPPGLHEPEHTPLTQVELEQAAGVPHCPVMSHVCTALADAAHCTALGVHTPWHAPLTHAWLLQAAGALQAPVALQVCTPLPEHWTAPGLQVP
jgi:hypothetical protein